MAASSSLCNFNKLSNLLSARNVPYSMNSSQFGFVKMGSVDEAKETIRLFDGSVSVFFPWNFYLRYFFNFLIKL